jgi:hypothetical protein
MFDGAELGKSIAAHRNDLHAAIAEYESAMFVRSAAAAVEAEKTCALCFLDDHAPQALIAFMNGSGSPPARAGS